MLFEDTYLTLLQPSEGVFKDRGSKFLSFAIPVSSEEEVKKELQRLRKEHPSANHHCYAFRIGADKNAFRFNDDGEPANSAGRPIFGQIQSKDLTNVLIVVARYFGGTLLGVSGLINAYRSAAADAIQNGKIIEKTVNDVYALQFEYLRLNEVMKIIKDNDLKVLSQRLELSCEIEFSVRKGLSVPIYDTFQKLPDLKISFLRTE
ncbi:MAG: IMPACT family protein [Bacteroidia bacterium]